MDLYFLFDLFSIGGRSLNIDELNVKFYKLEQKLQEFKLRTKMDERFYLFWTQIGNL